MTYAYAPFKGRSLDPTRRVRVYRNLHGRGGRWSLLQRGLVVGHADECALVGVRSRGSTSSCAARESPDRSPLPATPGPGSATLAALVPIEP